MAFGTHWEWRGFGEVDDALRARILALPLRYAPDLPTRDLYLWTPQCAVNVKLRHGDLKFKRLLETTGDLEHWLEDERELYPFPLEPAIMAELTQVLGIGLSPWEQAPVEREQLLGLLKRTKPSVQVMVVEKIRRLHHWHGAHGQPIIVELTEITRPERITTVAVEHEVPARVRDVLSQLKPGIESLRHLNYMQALAIWSRGKRIAPHFE